MIATTQPAAKKLKPLSSSDFLKPGGRPLPGGDFLEKMRPFLSGEITGSKGQHTLRATQAPPAPIGPMDSIPGVRIKGTPQPMAPLTPADRIPGVRAHAKDQNVEAQARKWVAQTFFGTLLKQMHDSPFKSELFSGGRGGKAFEPLMDQHLADHMTRGAGKKLVAGIVKQLNGKAAKAYEKQAAAGNANPYSDLNTGNSTHEDSSGGEQRDGKPPRGTLPNPISNSNTRGYVPTGLRG